MHDPLAIFIVKNERQLTEMMRLCATFGSVELNTMLSSLPSAMKVIDSWSDGAASEAFKRIIQPLIEMLPIEDIKLGKHVSAPQPQLTDELWGRR